MWQLLRSGTTNHLSHLHWQRQQTHDTALTSGHLLSFVLGTSTTLSILQGSLQLLRSECWDMLNH